MVEHVLPDSSINHVNIKRRPNVGAISEGEEGLDAYYGTFFVLKAHIVDFQKLSHRDEKLVLIDDIHLVQSPEGKIPSLIGLYCFQYVLEDIGGDLPLFESCRKGVFELFLRVANREPRKLCRAVANLKIQNVEGASQIVQCIPNEHSDSICGEWLHYDEAHISGFSLLLDANRIEVRAKPSPNKQNDIADVMIGPFNLEQRGLKIRQVVARSKLYQ